MDKIITDFSDFYAGWMNMYVYDYRTNEVRKVRISYIQNFFDDLVMLGRFLVSPLTGGAIAYEQSIDQEGFDSSITVKTYKYQTGKNGKMSVELRIGLFEDELHGKMLTAEEEKYNVEDHLYYTNVSVKDFVENIIMLIDKYKDEYNESFVLSPADRLNEESFNILKEDYYNKFIRGDEDEKISNS